MSHNPPPANFNYHRPTPADPSIHRCACLIGSALRGIEVDQLRRGGRPVLEGTGFTISQLLAEIAEMGAIKLLSSNFDLDPNVVIQALNGLSCAFEGEVTSSEILC